MAVGAASALADIAPVEPPSSRRLPLLGTLAEPPSLHAVREALRRPNRPLLLHWIAVGTFVTVGAILVLFAAAVYFGHRMNVDFATTDEGDLRSSGPLVLLGVAVLLAFPLAGFLVARASSTTSILEPAIGAGLAIALIILLISVTAPAGVLFALALAPAAFILACAGAWFGVAH
jgi:hypothetical protein